LTGLLFVALSVKGTELSKSPALRFRAAQTLVLFMTSVMIAAARTGSSRPLQRASSAVYTWLFLVRTPT
jgi:hypothetical protein